MYKNKGVRAIQRNMDTLIFKDFGTVSYRAKGKVLFFLKFKQNTKTIV